MTGRGIESLANVSRHEPRLLGHQGLEPGDQRIRLLAGVGVQRTLYDWVGQQNVTAETFGDDGGGDERRPDARCGE